MLSIPHGVVINRGGDGSGIIEKLCQERQVPILLTIPFRREIAAGNSQGELLVDMMPEYEQILLDLYETIQKSSQAVFETGRSSFQGGKA